MGTGNECEKRITTLEKQVDEIKHKIDDMYFHLALKISHLEIMLEKTGELK